MGILNFAILELYVFVIIGMTDLRLDTALSQRQRNYLAQIKLASAAVKGGAKENQRSGEIG